MHTDANNDDEWCEEIYFREINNPTIDYERAYNTERDSSIRNIWDTFEQSANAVTTLYKGNFNIQIIAFKDFLMSDILIQSFLFIFFCDDDIFIV